MSFASDFLSRLHGRLDPKRDGQICFLVKSAATGRCRPFNAPPGELPWELLRLRGSTHVWVSVSSFRGKRLADNAVVVPAAWVDVDPPDDLARDELRQWQEDAYERLATFKPATSLIVFSGRGWHAYWLLREPVRLHGHDRDLLAGEVVGLNRGLARRLGGDCVHDLARVMRLPGSVNPKTGNPCRLVQSSGPSYKFDELVALVRPEPEQPALALRRGPASSLTVPLAIGGPATTTRSGRGRPSLGVTVRDLRSLPPWARRLVVGGAWVEGARYRRAGGGPDRSRADMAAVCAMVRAGWPNSKIVAAFRCRDWYVGLRFRQLEAREGTKRASDYLARTVAKARDWLVAPAPAATHDEGQTRGIENPSRATRRPRMPEHRAPSPTEVD